MEVGRGWLKEKKRYKVRTVWVKPIYFAKTKPTAKKYFRNWVKYQKRGSKSIRILGVKKSRGHYEVYFVPKRR